MKTISTEKVPKPAGHYSQGIVHNGLVYVSGQLGIDPDSGEKVIDSVENEMQQVLNNVKGVLEAAGSHLDQVIKVTVYVSDISLWNAINRVYAGFFGDHKPVRVIVPSGKLHHGFHVEMEAIAAIDTF